MLHRRIYQFLLVYAGGLGVLFAIKFLLGLSDYVIPGPQDIWTPGVESSGLIFWLSSTRWGWPSSVR